MKNKKRLSCWLLTTGEAGCYSQILGVAKALGVDHEKKVIQLGLPWKLLPGHLCPFPLKVTKYLEDKLTPPWPDLILSCGRRTVAAAIGIKADSNGSTKIVHIQDPRVPAKYFDAVIAPKHDNYAGQNVMETIGAVHHVTKGDLILAKNTFAPSIAHLPHPRVGVLLGGNSHSHTFTIECANKLADGLIELHKEDNCSLLITPSRRTPPEVSDLIKSKLKGIPHYFWDFKSENPYFGILGSSDFLIATSDSVSMVSEACFTEKPVYLFPLKGHKKRHEELLNQLIALGLVRMFDGKIEKWSYQSLDESTRAADFLRKMGIV